MRSHAQKHFAKLEQFNINEEEVFENEGDSQNAESIENLNGLSEAVGSKAITSTDSIQVALEDGKKRGGKKCLKGPYRPGKRPIQCDSLEPLNAAVPASAIVHIVPPPELKKHKADSIVYEHVLNSHNDSLELDKSVLEHNLVHDKSNDAEPDFDVAPAENIQPLILECVRGAEVQKDSTEVNYNRPTGLDLSTGLVIEESKSHDN